MVGKLPKDTILRQKFLLIYPFTTSFYFFLFYFPGEKKKLKNKLLHLRKINFKNMDHN